MAVLQKPPRLSPGDPIPIVAPASAPLHPEHLRRGIAHLESLGYRVESGRESYPPHGYLSGTDDERLTELNAALRRRDARVIMAVRGGYGTLRLLSRVDYDAAAAAPKLVVGYSDITALHMALYHKARIPGVAGGMVAVDWQESHPPSEAQFWRVLSGEHPMTLDGPSGEKLIPVRTGEAEGVLLGGNLTLIARLVGTPYLPPLEKAILFFEEVGEPPYRIDGLLAQMKLSGILDRLAGVVIGEITESDPLPGRPSLSVDEVIADYFSAAPYPVARGLRFGHVREKVAVPIGVLARLEVSSAEARLTVLESVVE